jgi:apolipoprotein N-acyltransferase
LNLYIKIIKYFTINIITRGFVIAFLSAGAIYLDWLGIVNYFINTILGLLTIYWLLQSNRKVWFWSGFFIGLLWFWWISVSFTNYGFGWAMPIGIVSIALIYGIIFLLLAKTIDTITPLFTVHSSLFTIISKALALLILSYIHPFGFDWFDPEPTC